MSKTFACPNCAAPLDYDGGSDYTITCPHCASTVIVPENLRTDEPRLSGAFDLVQLAGKSTQLAEMARLIRAGRKIGAVKLYRQIFGVGLKDAKDAVEQLARGKPVHLSNMTLNTPRITAVELAPAQTRLIGCIVLAVIGLVVLGILLPIVVNFAVIAQDIPSLVFTTQTPARAAIAQATSTRTSTPSPTPGFMHVTMQFGNRGTGPGTFEDARSIAVDGAGNIYVAEYTGGRIQVFDAAGKFTTQWLVDERAPLTGLAADRKGTVYVVQNGAILKFEGTTGKALGQIQYAEGNRFDSVMTLPDGGLFSMWYSQRTGIFTTTVGFRDDLVRFDAEGKTVRVFPTFLSGQTGSVELGTQIGVDGLGNIFALGGSFSRAVYVFNREGKFQNKFGSRGDQPGQFRSPSAIAIDNQSRVYVADSAGVLVFAPDGRYLDTFRVEGGFPSGMVFNDRNELFIVARTRVLKYALTKP